MKKISFLFAVCISLSMLSCMPTTNLYTWYKYEDLTYQYSKAPTDELKVKVLEQYQKMEKQLALRKVVPPGLYAEYGFMLVNNGEKQKGIELLKKEVSLYPESSKYINRIIQQLEK